MACPFFDPRERRPGIAGARDGMLPLGDVWAGLCCAEPDRPSAPDQSLERHCNLGYARGVCARFPVGEAPDAVRFAICDDLDGVIAVAYAIERDHHPFDYGRLAWSESAGEFLNPHPEPYVERQARAYVESYRRRAGRL